MARIQVLVTEEEYLRLEELLHESEDEDEFIEGLDQAVRGLSDYWGDVGTIEVVHIPNGVDEWGLVWRDIC